MTPIEMLEKLVEKGIKFEVSNLQFSLIWKIFTGEGLLQNTYGESASSLTEAITALYQAAVTAYPERFRETK